MSLQFRRNSGIHSPAVPLYMGLKLASRTGVRPLPRPFTSWKPSGSRQGFGRGDVRSQTNGDSRMKSTRIAIAVAAVLALGACQNGQGPDKTDIGTILGGVGGAVAGAQFGHGTGRVAAAAAGTLIGAFVGREVGK